VTKPSDAVQAYLDALAAGQADTALALADTAPADKTFLTNEVLAASNKIAPLTEINVPEVTDEFAYQVAATYKIGDQAVSEDISVRKSGDGWKVRDVAADLRLGSLRNKTLPMAINGVAVKTDRIRLFPGAYQFSTGSRYISYGNGEPLLVQSPSDYPRGLSDLQPTLTEAGDKAFTAAVKDSLSSCLKSDQLANKGCPNNVTRVSGCTPKDGTIEWTANKDALDNLRPQLDYSNPAVAEANVVLGLSGEGAYRGTTCRVTPFSTPDPRANMLRDPVRVTWSN
jgi:hypothetical protein